jgi:nucleoside-specific outer membrane channel protein Tsx
MTFPDKPNFRMTPSRQCANKVNGAKLFLPLMLFCFFFMQPFIQAKAQVLYQGGSNVQFLYGRDLNKSADLATISLEHFGMFGAIEHFGFADTYNDVSLKSPNIYSEWYPKLSLSRATGSQIKLGPISDVLLGGGMNVLFGGEADFFVYLAGGAFKFDIPGPGLLQLETHYYKQTGSEYNGTYQITPSWDIPLPVTDRFRLRVRGFLDYIGDRGPGTTQIITQPQLLVDLGSFRGKPDAVFFGTEWRYWHNVVGLEDVNEFILQANLLFNF